ncbi:MAG: hypothetical protein LBN38_08780, partial [Verrucomicrobiota bacterium]|nr:hypothetical protein [Verrucomicrobiota bacterium]
MMTARCGFAPFFAGLVACACFAAEALAQNAQVPMERFSGLTGSYLEFADRNEWVVIDIVQDATTGKITTNLEWQSGYEPTEDVDNDGLLNQEEWNGWPTTINGQSGWFTCNVSNLTAGVEHFGPGAAIQRFDTDCDGISDLYEYYSGTNPRSGDTDGDSMPDAVESYAGLSPLEDGFVYMNVPDGQGGFTREVMTDDLGNKMMTIWHPSMDVDGDGLTTKQEIQSAMRAPVGVYCPEKIGDVTAHFPWTILDGVKWTNPLDCDSDSDWLLDSFERSWKGLDPLGSETLGEPGHYNSDPDQDGLTNFREQCLHPLLAYGWGNPLATWPFESASMSAVAGVDPFWLAKIGAKFGGSAAVDPIQSSAPGSRILNGTVGYLRNAQYNKPGDQQMFYRVEYDAEGNPTVELAGLSGGIQWPNPKTYWTCPTAQYDDPHDTDGDGLPDGWEVEHGLNPLSGILYADDWDEESGDEWPDTTWIITLLPDTDPSGSFGDPDGDGLINLAEYYGQDGHRIDYVTGTGDETIPWVSRAINYPNRSSFDDYLNANWVLLRNDWQAPYRFNVAGEAVIDGDGEVQLVGLDVIYSMINYPGFFNAFSMVEQNPETAEYGIRTTTRIVQREDPITEEMVLVEEEIPYLLPTAGVPAPALLNDMLALASVYGPDFEAREGEGAFQPFATAYSSLYYVDDNGDGRYTPELDPLWFSLLGGNVYMGAAMGDVILNDPNGTIELGSVGSRITDNIPMMVPMPGMDTDEDGLPDSMEIRMDAARDKAFSSPVHSLSPLLNRSARIVSTNGMSTLFVDYMFYFSRQFTVEAWVFLEGEAPADGIFIRGGTKLNGKDLAAYELGVKEVRVNGQLVSTVPYIGLNEMGGVQWYQASATRPLPRGRWVHLAGAFDPDKDALTLYIDGTLEQSVEVKEETVGNYLQSVFGEGGTLVMGQGRDQNADFVDRLWLDEVRIWGVERSAKEISDHNRYLLQGRQPVTIDAKSLVGSLLSYFNFDNGGKVAVDGRYRAMSSLYGYSFPAQASVANRLYHEYMYPDLAYAMPSAELGGGFIFDASRVAPVLGGVDAQQGEYDSDGDGLPDAWEVIHGMNPFSWYTKPHEYGRHDKQWGTVADAEILITRNTLLSFSSSLDGGATWEDVTCPLLLETVNGVVTQRASPDTILIGGYTVTTNFVEDAEGNATTNMETVVTTNWVVTSGQVLPFIEIGQTWWVSTGGVPVAPQGSNGRMLSDADGDLDGDGLSNQYEYWARTNPNKKDTNEDGIADGDEDFDGDGLPNLLEQHYGARPDLVDTDDDGMSDLAEVALNSESPELANSKWPKKSLAAYFNGRPGSYVEMTDSIKYAQDSWTIEATVLPASLDFLVDGQGAPIFRRGVEEVTNGMLVANYELRVVRDGNELYPEARYVYKKGRGLGEPIAVRGANPLPRAEIYDGELATRLAATYDANGKRLRLYVNGELAGERRDMLVPLAKTGEGPSGILRIGERFHGYVDEVRLWNSERSASAVQSTLEQSLTGAESGLMAYFNFDDGGWTNILTSNTIVNAAFSNLLYSVRYTSRPDVAEMRDGDTWLENGTVYVNDTGVIAPLNVSGPIFTGGGVEQGAAEAGQFGWNYTDQLLYRYDGSAWVRWGKAPNWLADARAMLVGRVTSLDEIMTNYDPTPGDMFIDTARGVVYIYRYTLPSEEGPVAEMLADPLMPGHRFYLRSQEAIVEWTGTELITIARASQQDGVYIRIQSEGMAYKAESRVWRKWGFVPTTEDDTSLRDWETGWRFAAQVSGAVDFYEVAQTDTTYVPTGGEDTDGDGLPDAWEIRYGLDYKNPGFSPVSEILYDENGMPNYIYNSGDFQSGPWGDPDYDGLNNRAEYLAGTDPTKFDTFGMAHSDYESSATPGGASFGSLYMDGDDIPDAWEALFPKALSPLRYDANLDPDGDGWDNYSEYMAGNKLRNANVYQVTTNESGVVSSNWASAEGYYIPYCDPGDPSIYPKPNITFHFKTDCPEISGTLWVYAYTDPEMNCPDVATSIVLDAPIRNGNSLSISDWVNGGHLRQGANYFMAFVDGNANGQWDEGEILGFSERMPENISWDSANVNIALRDHGNGLPRLSWASALASSSTNAPESVTISVKQINTMVFQTIRSGCSASRNYLHEYDFINVLGSSAPFFGNYRWSVIETDTTNILAEGVSRFDSYPATLDEPVIHNPVGRVLMAGERLRLTLDRNATTLRTIMENAAGVRVLDETIPAPYVDTDGLAEMDFPRLFGFDGLVNGTYRLKVVASNPRTSVTSDVATVSVDQKSPAVGGAAMISGTIHYFGWNSNASIVVEAYANVGFDQLPVAKTLAKPNGTYQLMGIPLGSVYVRAFQDQNGNGILDPGEAWGLVKGLPQDPYAFTWGVAAIKRSRGGVSRSKPASIYAVDYSVLEIAVQTFREYDGHDVVIHDADSDNDGLPDTWELTYANSLDVMNQNTDTDGDGLSDVDEFLYNTAPTQTDTDGDRLSDYEEVKIHRTNPTKADTDGDGLSDYEEVRIYRTNPTQTDTDGDGLADYAEVTGRLNPFENLPTNPNNSDTDADGMPDGWEIAHGFNPLDPDDGALDADRDGLNNLSEYTTGTDPYNPDTDGDGYP